MPLPRPLPWSTPARRHRAALAVALAWVVTALVQPATAQTVPDDVRASAVRLSGSVLRIEAPRPRGGYSLGSGVVVGEHLVVTNCHVTRESSQLSVLRGGVRWRVTAQLADVDHDLCLLHAPGVQAPVVPLAAAAQAPLIGQAVLALGYTGGLDLQHSYGAVVDLHRLGDGSVVQTSNGFNSGASGGGLFDAEGRLVGVLTFRLRGGEQHYFAAPAAWVHRLLQRANAGELPPVAPLDPALQPYWQAPGDRQPAFLQAARLLREQRWDDLAGLSRRWLLDDPQDGEPWYLLGLALDGLAQPAQARQAFDCALRLQPQRPAAPPSAGQPPAAPAVARAAASDQPTAPPAPERLAGAVPCPGAA